MKKKGWEPYSLKFKYLIPLIIYLVFVTSLLAYDWSQLTPSIITVIGIVILLTSFLINYVVGIRRIFTNVIVKFKIYNFVFLLGWIIISTALILLQAMFLPEIMDARSLIASFFFLGFGTIIYLFGMNKVIKKIKDISI